VVLMDASYGSNTALRASVSALALEAVRRHAKVERIVINSIQTSFVSERMLMFWIEAPELRRRAFDLLKKRQIPFYPQLRRMPAT
jgi:hypothetical protein